MKEAALGFDNWGTVLDKGNMGWEGYLRLIKHRGIGHYKGNVEKGTASGLAVTWLPIGECYDRNLEKQAMP